MTEQNIELKNLSLSSSIKIKYQTVMDLIYDRPSFNLATPVYNLLVKENSRHKPAFSRKFKMSHE